MNRDAFLLKLLNRFYCTFCSCCRLIACCTGFLSIESIISFPSFRFLSFLLRLSVAVVDRDHCWRARARANVARVERLNDERRHRQFKFNRQNWYVCNGTNYLLPFAICRSLFLIHFFGRIEPIRNDQNVHNWRNQLHTRWWTFDCPLSLQLLHSNRLRINALPKTNNKRPATAEKTTNFMLFSLALFFFSFWIEFMQIFSFFSRQFCDL